MLPNGNYKSFSAFRGFRLQFYDYSCRSHVAQHIITAREQQRDRESRRGDTWGETLEVDWERSSLDFSKVAPPPKAPYFPFISVNTDLTEMSGKPCRAFSSSVLNPRTLTLLHPLHPAASGHAICFFWTRLFSPPQPPPPTPTLLL
jgi:hypothetical protein